MQSLPLAVVYSLGLVMALMQYQRLPRVAAAAGGGFGALLLLMLVRPVIDSMIYGVLREDGRSIHLLLTMTGFVFSLLSALAIGAVAFAIFVDRPEVQLPIPSRRPPGPQPWEQR